MTGDLGLVRSLDSEAALELLLRVWYDLELPDAGSDELGVPPALTRLWAASADTVAFGHQNRLYSAADVDRSQALVRFYSENQGIWFADYVADGSHDPVVQISWDDLHDPSDWLPGFRLTDFVFREALQEAIWAAPDRARGELSADALAALLTDEPPIVSEVDHFRVIWTDGRALACVAASRHRADVGAFVTLAARTSRELDSSPLIEQLENYRVDVRAGDWLPGNGPN